MNSYLQQMQTKDRYEGGFYRHKDGRVRPFIMKFKNN
jgi:hypothetical protein